MPEPDLVAAFDDAHGRYIESVDQLVPLLIRMAVGRVQDALPTTHVLEAEGELTEDWSRTLRIRRVLDRSGAVLFDVTVGHDGQQVEDAIDDANSEYLDFLMDLTGDIYMGQVIIEIPDSPAS
ncbi:MAG: hypothetical protein ABI470_02150 [Aquihabitans sp.]